MARQEYKPTARAGQLLIIQYELALALRRSDAYWLATNIVIRGGKGAKPVGYKPICRMLKTLVDESIADHPLMWHMEQVKWLYERGPDLLREHLDEYIDTIGVRTKWEECVPYEPEQAQQDIDRLRELVHKVNPNNWSKSND